MSLGVSVFTLTALGGDRYTAIVNPMSKHMGNPIARTIITAVSIWVASIALAIVDGISARISYHQHGDTQEVFYTCVEYPADWGEWYPKFHTIFRFIIYFALPVYIIALFYVMIARILVHSSYHMPVEGGIKSSQGNKQVEARKKVAIVVLLLVVIFIICWLPRHIFSMWYHFDPNDYNQFWHIFKVTGFCLCFINSCVNPITLYFLSKQFRKYFNRYLFCLCSRKKRLRADVTSTSMYNFNSTVRRTSTTMTMIPNSQSL
jgi:gastrin-releasing peptide receptor